VFVDGSTVYVGTYGGSDGGLRISTDGGATFTTKTTANGLGNNGVSGVYAVGSTVYAATNDGFSISTNGGTSFTNTRLSGLGDWIVYGVYAVGSTIYAATANGLSISTNGGATFTNKTTTNGLGSNTVWGVFAVVAPALQVTNKEIAANTATLTTSTAHGLAIGSVVDVSGVDATFNGTYTVTAVTTSAPYQFSYAKTAADVSSSAVSPAGVATFNTVYAATGNGVSISRNGGGTFTNYLAAGGMGNTVNGVYAVGSTVYAATSNGLSISIDGGATFITKTTANGLGSNNVLDVFAVGTTVYAATDGGLSISTNGGTSFTNDTTENCLGSDLVYGVYAVVSTVYAATYGGGLSISTGVGAGCRTSGGGGGGGGGSSSETASSSESAVTTPVVAIPVVAIPVVAAIPPGTNPNIPASGLTPGSSVFLVNGVASTLTIKPNQPVEPRSLVATGDGFTMELEGRGSNGQPLGLTSDAALRLERGSFAEVKGTGFAPNSDVQVYLYSTTRFLGTIRTNASGAFDGSVPVPADIELGRHTLQANALGSDNNVRSLSIGVVLEATAKGVRTAKATVSFDSLSAALTPKAKKALRSLAKKTKATATGGLVVGYVQRDGNPANNASLSKQRARAIAAFLKANGITAPLGTRGNGAWTKQTDGRIANVSVSYTS
jgi:outer membrane protein OmpA-like peptidoglycan-associated protein